MCYNDIHIFIVNNSVQYLGYLLPGQSMFLFYNGRIVLKCTTYFVLPTELVSLYFWDIRP